MNENKRFCPRTGRWTEWRDWFDTVRPGDVLKDRKGNYRVVRQVTRYKNAICFTFVIRRCSWTRRCYTTMSKTDILYKGFHPIGVRVRLDTKLDKDIAHDLTYENRFAQKVPCCKVVAIGVV